MTEHVDRFTVDALEARVFRHERELGAAAARHTASLIRDRVAEAGEARVVMATGNSQLAFVRALRDEVGVPWDAVSVFHLDEYVGIDAGHPASFRRWIATNVAAAVKPRRVEYLAGDAASLEAECARYERLLREKPLDLVCMGIGENGHVAFNEPGRTDFADRQWVRVVELDQASRSQQVGEGHFPTLGDVPAQALTVTVPALLAARVLQVAVPEARKSDAVRRTLSGVVSPAVPASILRQHTGALLFVDDESVAGYATDGEH